MGYSVKWIEDNMGITRKALRYYEEKGLLPKNVDGNYRNYEKEDLKRIWAIKTFLKMGFTTKELINCYETYKDSDDVFYELMSSKTKEFEQDIAEKKVLLELLRTAKFTGRFPDIRVLGDMIFENFFEEVKDKFIIQRKENISKELEIIQKDTNTLTENELEMMEKMLSNEDNKISNITSSYHTVIASFKDYDSDSEIIQTLLKRLYMYLKEKNIVNNPEEIKRLDPLYYEGDLKRMFEIQYGKDGCEFISEAMSVFINNMRKENKE